MKVMMTVLLVGVGLAWNLGRAVLADADKSEFEGVWTLVRIEIDGKPREAGSAKLTVTGNKFVVKTSNDKVVVAGTFKLDATKNPKTSDTIYTEGVLKGKTLPGIYQLDGDTLKFCRAGSADQERPTEFATKPNTGQLMSVYKRDKK